MAKQAAVVTCSGACWYRGNVDKLLNRLLGCQVDMQSKIFGYFSALQVGSRAALQAVVCSYTLLPLALLPLPLQIGHVVWLLKGQSVSPNVCHVFACKLLQLYAGGRDQAGQGQGHL